MILGLALGHARTDGEQARTSCNRVPRFETEVLVGQHQIVVKRDVFRQLRGSFLKGYFLGST